MSLKFGNISDFFAEEPQQIINGVKITDMTVCAQCGRLFRFHKPGMIPPNQMHPFSPATTINNISKMQPQSKCKICAVEHKYHTNLMHQFVFDPTNSGQIM